jgi:hypothetical protein
MKFKLWLNHSTYTTFLFIGKELYKKHKSLLSKIEKDKDISSEEQEILNADIPKSLWYREKNLIFVDKVIYKDDNINMVLKRLCVYLKQYFEDSCPDDVYMWIKKSVVKNPSLIANFVGNCFQNQKMIVYEEFKQTVKNYFDDLELEETDFNLIDKNLAFKLLMNSNIKNVIEPIQFKYIYNEYFKYIQYNPISESIVQEDTTGYGKNSYYAMTLQYFGEIDCINIILYKHFNHLPWFFPYHTKANNIAELVEYIEDLDMIEDGIKIDTSNCSHKGNISFMQFKVNEINFNKISDLGRVFDKFTTSEIMPFMKYRTYTNVYYKVDKDFIKDFNNYQDYWNKWTELTGIGRKYPDNTSLILKVRFKNHGFCSFRIYDNFSYDVKFSIGKSRKTILSKIIEFCDIELNKIIKELRNLYPQSYIPDIQKDNISIIQITTVDSISLEKKTIKTEGFSDIINKLLFPYFNIVPTKERNILNLQYKKVDNYLKYDNITAFIMNKPTMHREEIIKELSRWFRIPITDAAKEYEAREGQIDMELEKQGDKKVFKLRSTNFVTVRIKTLGRSDPNDMEFEVTGFKYFETHDQIVELLKSLVNLTNMSIKIEGINIKNIEHGLHEIKKDDTLKLKDIDKDNIAEVEIDPDFMEEEEKAEYAESIGEVPIDLEIDKDFLNILEEYKHAPEAEEHPEEEEKEQESKRRISYFSRRLKEADGDLFNYTPPTGKKRQDYSTLCSGRYPVVVNKDQKDHIDKTFPGSYSGYLKTGSTPELANKNYYICPAIWCPKSMIAMTKEQYVQNNKQCPFENEEAIHLSGSYWKEGSKRFISVLDPYIHPKNFCMPCCFKGESIKGKHKNNLDICKKRKPDLIYIQENEKTPIVKEDIIEEFIEDEIFIGNPKYIKGEFNWPLHSGHYGVLPKPLYEALGNKKCGDRPDGTGNMILDNECFLRRGSTNKDTSFLACIVEILDNPEITSINDIYKILLNDLTLERFLSLENGKILKIFINDRFNIFDQNCYKEFAEWFIEQKRYVLKFNLGKVYRSLLNPKNRVSFSKDVRYYKDVIREFMVYNSYKHYLDYIKTTRTFNNEHRPFIDLFNSEKELLNPKNINIVVIEVHEENVTIQCLLKNNYNKNNPFSFIIWNGRYYELLTKTKYSKEYSVDARYIFYYKQSLSEIKNLIDFVCNNCKTNASTTPEKIISDIELATGLKTKYLVLDYGFKVKGILLNKNLYVPFENKIFITNLMHKKFVYYSDIINYKCKIDAKKAYVSLAKLNKFYKVSTANDTYLKLESRDLIIPIDIKKTDIYFGTFEDDLEIFIENEKDDERKNIISVINENKKVFGVFLNAVIMHINTNPELKAEISFLTDFKNPFPVNFKRAKITKLMSEIVANVLIVPDTKEAANVISRSGDAVIPCPDPLWETCLVGLPREKIDEFKTKVSEQLLINHSLYFDSRVKIFKYAPSEFLFEHHEIVIGKHRDYIKRLQDPFKILTERLDEEFGELVFAVTPEENDYVKTFIGDAEFKNNYDKFKLIVRNAFVVDVETKYSNMYIYQWFHVLYKTLHSSTIQVDASYLKKMVRNNMINDYETDKINELIENKSFEQLLKEYKKKNRQYYEKLKPSVDICDEFFNSVQYFPGVYEIRILSEFIGVNVIIFTRSSRTNENGLEFINNRSSHYILIYHKFDNRNVRDIYEILVVDQTKKKAIFNRTDLSELLQRIKMMNMLVEIDVPEHILASSKSTQKTTSGSDSEEDESEDEESEDEESK